MQTNQLCNINTKGISRRRNIGYWGLLIASLCSFVFWQSSQMIFLSLGLLGWFIAAIGFLQAELKFCVYNGMSGIDEHGSAPKKATAAARQQYWLQSIKVVTYAVLIAFIATLSVVYVGLLIR